MLLKITSSKSLPLNFPSSSFLAPPSCIHLLSATIHNKNRRRPSKFSGYGLQASPQVQQKMQHRMDRIFTKQSFKIFGMDKFENMKLILATRGQNFRWLDEGKKKQLVTLFTNIIPNLVAVEKTLQDIVISKIEMPDVFHQIRVFWRPTGDVEKDRCIQERLDQHEGALRLQLQEMFHNMNMPPLKFAADRKYSMDEEMNKLFEMADYGGVDNGSDTGKIALQRVAGEEDKGKAKGPPGWLESWRRRVKEKDGGRGKKKKEEETMVDDGHGSDSIQYFFCLFIPRAQPV